MGGVIWRVFMQYWELTLLSATWLAIAAVAWRKRGDWRRKRFSSTVNFSLNLLQRTGEGREVLALRTLFEASDRAVWVNDFGIKCVQRAIKGTTEAQPFLRVVPTQDAELVNHAVLNVLAERFSEASLAQALGLPVRCERFLFGLTWERYGEMYSEKLRVMVAKAQDLERLFGAEQLAQRIELERPSHRPRLRTLEAMYALSRSLDEQTRAVLGEVELGLAVGPQSSQGPSSD